jgi:LmbE family N-acetylglucosaminyl deacetylase
VRRQEALQACLILGITETIFLDLPDGELVADSALRDLLAAQIVRLAPDWIFAPTPVDAHRDHVAAARASCEVWRRVAAQARFFRYEVWSPIAGNRIVDISGAIEAKREALRAYRLPLRYCDYLGAADGLARYRALQLGPHAQYAEVFEELVPPDVAAGPGHG